MKKNKRPLVIGNWKTNPASFVRAKERFQEIKRSAAENSGIDVVICPPFPYISALAGLVNSSKNISVGAQDLSVYGEGSKTGEVSAHMIESSGAKVVIIGHSERRAMGETDAIVAAKVGQALKTGMQIVICVGETERDNDGVYLDVIKKQLKEALAGLERSHFKQIVIAYEPVWAIGRKDNVAITSHDLHQMVIYIKKLFTEWWSDTVASMVPILYGGSVTAENAQDIMWNGMVDGLLVGRASWEVETFGPLLKALNSRKRSPIKLTIKKPREDAIKASALKTKKISSKRIIKKSFEIVKKASRKVVKDKVTKRRVDRQVKKRVKKEVKKIAKNLAKRKVKKMIKKSSKKRKR